MSIKLSPEEGFDVTSTRSVGFSVFLALARSLFRLTRIEVASPSLWCRRRRHAKFAMLKKYILVNTIFCAD